MAQGGTASRRQQPQSRQQRARRPRVEAMPTSTVILSLQPNGPLPLRPQGRSRIAQSIIIATFVMPKGIINAPNHPATAARFWGGFLI